MPGYSLLCPGLSSKTKTARAREERTHREIRGVSIFDFEAKKAPRAEEDKPGRFQTQPSKERADLFSWIIGQLTATLFYRVAFATAFLGNCCTNLSEANFAAARNRSLASCALSLSCSGSAVGRRPSRFVTKVPPLQIAVPAGLSTCTW